MLHLTGCVAVARRAEVPDQERAYQVRAECELLHGAVDGQRRRHSACATRGWWSGDAVPATVPYRHQRRVESWIRSACVHAVRCVAEPGQLRMGSVHRCPRSRRTRTGNLQHARLHNRRRPRRKRRARRGRAPGYVHHVSQRAERRQSLDVTAARPRSDHRRHSDTRLAALHVPQQDDRRSPADDGSRSGADHRQVEAHVVVQRTDSAGPRRARALLPQRICRNAGRRNRVLQWPLQHRPQRAGKVRSRSVPDGTLREGKIQGPACLLRRMSRLSRRHQRDTRPRSRARCSDLKRPRPARFQWGLSVN